MKKLLVLALVLSIATVANAALTLTLSATEVGIGEAIDLGINNSVAGTDGLYVAYLALLDDGSIATWTGTHVLGANAIPEISISYWGYDPEYGEDNIEVINSNPALYPSLPAGKTVDFGLEGVAEGTVTILLYDEGFVEIDSVSVEVIPEPATMLLLGLGGLLIRRKK